MTTDGIAIPLHPLFCAKQGRANTDEPSLPISVPKELTNEFLRYEIDITLFPITSDSWSVSGKPEQELTNIGFGRIVLAGKSNHVFGIREKKQKISERKKEIVPIGGQRGTDVPSRRVKAESPTFGDVVLFFFGKSTTKIFYLIGFGVSPMRGAGIWHVRKQHHIIGQFRKISESLFGIRPMRLRGDGLHSALPMKIVSYLPALRLRSHKKFSKHTLTQIMREIRREYDLKKITDGHFHRHISNSQTISG